MQRHPAIALVTGASTGIGLEVVRQLSRLGWHVFLTARNRAAGENAARQLGDGVTFLEMDVANADSIRRAAEEVAKRVDHLDVLINNAAIYDKDVDLSVLDVSAQVILDALTTNALGPILVTQAFLPLLLKSDDPRLVNVSSGWGLPDEMENCAPAYSISKAALGGVTKQFALALAGRAAVNCVCPGWVQTKMGGPGATRSVDEGADTIVWLAAEAPRHETGKFWRDRTVIDW